MEKLPKLNSPLILTERIKTSLGMLRVVLSSYQTSGLLSVELVSDIAPVTDGLAPVRTSLSVDPSEPAALKYGEFVVKPVPELMMKTFLASGLFTPTGKVIANREIWRLSGTALLEFNSAFAPSKAASRASFPSHLFGRRHFDPASKQMLAAEFDKQGFTEHSPEGESVWVVREYCEQNRIPFVIYLVNKKNAVIGARVCKAELAKKIVEKNQAEGYAMVTVYESPRLPWQHIDVHAFNH